MEGSRACVHALIRGRVQRVGFRYHTRARARELGVCGWVRNLEDGRVEALLEGEQPAVDALLAWLRHGPVGARVEAVEVSPGQAEGRSAFMIQ